MPRSNKIIISVILLKISLAFPGSLLACDYSGPREYNPKIFTTNTSVFAAINTDNNNLALFKVGKDLSIEKLWGVSLLNIGGTIDYFGPKLHVTNNGICAIEENRSFLPKISGEEIGIVFYCEGEVNKVYKIKDLVNLKDKELQNEKTPESSCGPALYQWKSDAEFSGFEFKVKVAGNKEIYFNPYDGEIICIHETSSGESCQAKSLSRVSVLNDFESYYKFKENSLSPEEMHMEQLEIMAKFLRATGDSLVINSKSDDTPSMKNNNKIAKARAMYFYNMLVSLGVPESQLAIREKAIVNKYKDNSQYQSKSSMRRVEFLSNE